MSNESTFKHELAKRLRMKGAHVTLIENMVGNGCPDMHVMHQGHDFWVETKGPASLTRNSGKIRKSQYAWMSARHAAGGSTLILGQDKDGVRFQAWFDFLEFTPISSDYVSFDRKNTKVVDTWDEYIHLVLHITKI